VSQSYSPPLDRLLKLGAEPAKRQIWPDYRHLGLVDRHVPELVRMASDPELHERESWDRAAWAPVHAWRALAQLDAQTAARPLLEVLERYVGHAWVFDELPQALGMIGPAALPGATLMLFDEDRPEPVRIAGGRVITDVAREHPDRRDEAVAVISKQLEDWPHQTPLLNGLLIAYLGELEAAEAAPLMEAAFAAGAVDLFINGDWEDVRVTLGLLQRRLTPPTEWSPLEYGEDEAPPPGRVPHAGSQAEKLRGRRKAQKQARKRNRKK